jgi:hypothetical protein
LPEGQREAGDPIEKACQRDRVLGRFSTEESGYPHLFPFYPQDHVLFFASRSGVGANARQKQEAGTGVNNRHHSFEPRRHWNQTQVRLILAGLALLVIVGGGLVWWLYGYTAAITAVTCFLGVAGVIGLLWGLLALLERWVREEEP